MNVLSVLHAPTFAGPHNQLVRLREPLARMGIRISAVLPTEPGNAAGRMREGGVEVMTMPLHRLRIRKDPRVHAQFIATFPREVRALRALIRSLAIDVVLINSLYNPHGACAARLEGTAVVWQIIDTVAPIPVRRLAMPAVTRLADVVMTTGTAVGRNHPGALALGDRFVPFSPPVDTAAMRPDAKRRVAARKELGVPDDAIVVGMVGNFNPTKGHEAIIRTVARLRSKQHNVHLRLLSASTPGHEAYELNLRRLVRQLAVGDDRLVVLDPGPRVAELLPALDVFALTSVPRSEGMPTVILEAMSCGLPVLATNVGSVEEIVEDGVTGFVIRPLDLRATEDALSVLIQDEGMRRRMGAVARERAINRYDVQICADLHAEAFAHAIGHAARRPRFNA